MSDSRVRSPVKARLYEARRGRALEPMRMESVQSTADKFTTPFNYILGAADEEQESISTVFGNVPIGSPLSYQLQDFNTSHIQLFTTNLEPEQHLISLGGSDSVTPSFPSLPKSIFAFSNSTLCLSESQKVVVDDLFMSLSDAQLLETRTVQQNKCSIWHQSRLKRLTSSEFGKIINRRILPTPSFVKSLFSEQNLQAVPSISHGVRNESLARSLYVKKLKKRLGHDIEVYACGFVVNPGLPFLGASPDGKVLDKSERDPFGLLEIKCPFKFRNSNIKDAALSSEFCLAYVADEIKLKRNHNYFYQVQGQMAISGIKWCDFVVYTFESIFVERIAFDETLWCNNMLPSLLQFYRNYGLPFLCDKFSVQTSKSTTSLTCIVEFE